MFPWNVPRLNTYVVLAVCITITISIYLTSPSQSSTSPAASIPTPATMSAPSEPLIHPVFEPATSTWQYVVADPATLSAVIIDPVLDYDPATSAVSTASADALLALVRDRSYKVVRLLETHAHADHLTAAKYLQNRLLAEDGGRDRVPISIGRRIGQVQSVAAARYDIPADDLDAAFDHLLDDDEVFAVGDLKAQALHLPGHTPDHMGYVIGSNVFCGDSLFNADVGSARCDFPGGSAPALYHSVRSTLLALPAHFRVFTGHDYPPQDGSKDGRRPPLADTTVGEQKRANKHLHDGVDEGQFVKWRQQRDGELANPRLIHYALQVNVRGGQLPRETETGDRFVRAPLKVPVGW